MRELHVLGLIQTGSAAGPGPWDDDLDEIETVYLHGGEFLVGECDGQVVAMGALKRLSGQAGEIKRMRVHPDFQRRGFGQAILDQLIGRVYDLGFQVLVLDTGVKQMAAQRLYERNGFRKVSEGQIGKTPSLFYEKRLGQADRAANSRNSH